jgi:outer membrane protein TolC
MARSAWPALVGAVLLSGCAVFQPRPLAPEHVETEFRQRGLSDPDLRAYLDANLSRGRNRVEPGVLDLDALTLIALYYHPDLDVARARMAAAEAGVVTAGARPNPTVAVVPEYNVDSTRGVSGWLPGLTFDLPVETAGKRGHRIDRARHLAEAARLDLAETAWRVRSRVRAALLEHLLGRRTQALLEAEERVRQESVAVMERRLDLGDVSRPDVDAGRAALAQVRLATRSAAGRVAESLAALAGALGVPVSALDGARLAWPGLEEAPGEDALRQHALQRSGLQGRPDVRRALEVYAASEALLQLEIARQYPDVHLGPGYQWDQGEGKFALGLTVTLPVLNRNEGPIAEAEARRQEAAARFLALQADIIGQIERARRRYGGTVATLGQAEEALRLLIGRERALERALEAGEADRLALVGTRVERALAARARLDALRDAQVALGALEDAVWQPLGPGQGLTAVPDRSPRPAP